MNNILISNGCPEQICSNVGNEDAVSTADIVSTSCIEVTSNIIRTTDDVDFEDCKDNLDDNGAVNEITYNHDDDDDDIGITPTGRKKRKRGKHKRKHTISNTVVVQNIGPAKFKNLKKRLLTRLGNAPDSAEMVSEIIGVYKTARSAKEHVIEAADVAKLAENHVSKIESQLQEAIDALKQARKVLKEKENFEKISLEKVAEAEMKIPCNWNNNFAKLKEYHDKHGNIGKFCEKFIMICF